VDIGVCTNFSRFYGSTVIALKASKIIIILILSPKNIQNLGFFKFWTLKILIFFLIEKFSFKMVIFSIFLTYSVSNDCRVTIMNVDEFVNPHFITQWSQIYASICVLLFFKKPFQIISLLRLCNICEFFDNFDQNRKFLPRIGQYDFLNLAILAKIQPNIALKDIK